MMKAIGVRSISLVLILCFFFLPCPARSEDPGDVLRATLVNGMQVVIVRNTLAPVVTTEINYLVGANESPEGFPGMAHAEEHMMFRGSPGLSAAELSNIMALMGGRFNANTQQTVTQYFFTIPKDSLETALTVEVLRMKGALNSQELWEKERGAIEQEVARDLSSPEYLLFKELLEKLFDSTPYAHDALGTRLSFQKTTSEMLKQFHESWYGPNNAILVIAGDVNPPQTLALVTRLFSSIPPRPLPARPDVKLLPPKASHIAFDTNLAYGLSVVAYRFPGYDSPDFAAAMVLADVLASKRGNLFALVPEGKALFADFESEMLPKAGFALATAGFPEGANGAGLVADMKTIIDGYIKDGLPPDLVAAAKHRAVTDAQFRKNSISGLARVWSQALTVEGRTSPDDTIEAIKKVTVEDVNRAARSYLQNDQAVTAILSPRPSGQPVASKGFGGGESFTPQQTTEVRLPSWAKKLLTVPAVPVSNVRPADIKLANGIRLIVRTEKISPTITLSGQVKHNDNLQEPPGKEGVASLLQNLFSYGTHSLDRVAFEKAKDDISADITAGASFSLRILPDHFEQGLELLADNLLRPALPEQAFSVVKEETTGALRGRLKSPGYLSQRALIKGLFPPHDPVLREATPETMAGITLDDVKSYHAGVFRPDMTTIVIIGDVTPTKAREAVMKYFGSWRASGARPVTDLPRVPPNKPSRHAVPDQSRVQDEVTLAQTLALTRSHPDYYTLALADHILSGAFYASRLYRDLRENAGLVYTVGSSLEAGKNRSIFSVFYGCDPPSVSRARTMVEQNLRAMQRIPVSAKELTRTKILLLRQIPLAESSTDAIAAGLLARSIQDLPLDEPVRAAKYYRKMTAPQIRSAFKKWIRPDGFVQVTEGSVGN